MCDVTRPFEDAEATGDTYLGVSEVADFLQVKPRTVNQWGFRRLLPDPDVMLHATSLWKRGTILRWAGDTGRLSSPALRAEYEMRWAVRPIPYRRGGRIPEPPEAPPLRLAFHRQADPSEERRCFGGDNHGRYARAQNGEEAPLPPLALDGAGVFAQYVQTWMACYGPLIEAAGTLRLNESESAALAALLATAPVRRLTASWELWESWSGQESTVPDRRLATHLGTEVIAWYRFALWGDGSTSPQSDPEVS